MYKARLKYFNKYSMQIYNHNNKELWQCLKRALRYLKGTDNIKLRFKKVANLNNILTKYVDSDWAANETDRRSTTGYLFKMFEKSFVSWSTMKQKSFAASSTEAEYLALFEGVRKLFG